MPCGEAITAAATWCNGFDADMDQSFCCHCSSCGTSLTNFLTESVCEAEPLEGLLELQRVVTAALIRGYFNVYGCDTQFALSSLPKILMAGALSFQACDEADLRVAEMFSDQTAQLLKDYQAATG